MVSTFTEGFIVLYYYCCCCSSDIPVTLIHPYCIGEEPTTYDIVDGHAVAGQGTFEVRQQQNTAVGSKGGYLTKRGNIVKVRFLLHWLRGRVVRVSSF